MPHTPFSNDERRAADCARDAWRAPERIRFALGQCFLGAILVAASETGVCAILLGDAPEQLMRELEELFPAAELVGADRAFETWMARVVGFVERPGTGLDLPLDLRGTNFRIRVWRALQEIPPGTRLGVPRAACRAGGGQRLRGEPAGGGDPLSSRGAHRWRTGRLSLGDRTQGRVAGSRGGA